MIVLLGTPAEKRDVRVRLYKDDVFLIAQEAVRELDTTLSIEELFASADQFTKFLLENDLNDRDVMQYEIDDLRKEVSDRQTFYILITLSFVKLCALRKTNADAENVARALVGFCQEYDGFTGLLKQLFRKEQSRWPENKRADLPVYELRCIENVSPPEDGNTIVAAFVEAASGLLPDAMQHVENTLSEVNDRFGHRYQKDVDRLRGARINKSAHNVYIDKVNYIHDNQNVNVYNDVRNSNKQPSSQGKAKATNSTETRQEKQHGVEYPVFSKGTGVTDRHIKALYKFLTARGWISTQTAEADFLRLFDGCDNNCEIIWTGQDKQGNNPATKLGKAALYVLFKEMADEGLITNGKSGGRVGPVLESHFVDPEGHFLTSVSNVNKVSSRTRSYINKILAMMRTRADAKFIQENLDEDLRTLMEQEGEVKFDKYGR